jgi:hypothetical protein
MAKAKVQTHTFATVQDMHNVPLEKIDLFCEDLRLWLKLNALAKQSGLAVKSPTAEFAWIDDGKHDIGVNIRVNVENVKL